MGPDGGGMVGGTGGDFELSGTTGQHDTGRPMMGGDFELTGGFWFALAPGDCNSDGGVNLFDYHDFGACLAGPSVPVEVACRCHDLNRNHTVDLADFAAMQTGFSGQ
jgi:hypothetical protein